MLRRRKRLRRLRVGAVVRREADIRPIRPIEKLAIAECRHARQDILHEHHAAPAYMAEKRPSGGLSKAAHRLEGFRYPVPDRT